MGMMTALSRFADRAAAWARDRPRVMHVAGTVVFTAVCIVLVVVGDVGFFIDRGLGTAVFLGPIAVAATASALRRRAPGATLALSLVAVALDVALGGSSAVILYLVDGLYSASCYGGTIVRRVTAGVAVAGVALTTAGPMSEGLGAVVFGALQGVAIFGTPVWWGTNVRQRNEIAALGEQRLELERTRNDDTRRIAELQRDEAVRHERARMASELHDVVASRLSAIAINSAAGLTVADADDADGWRRVAERQRETLATVRESSVGALDDMRSLITVLRAGDEPLAPVAVDASLAGLERQVREAESASTISIALDLPDAEMFGRVGDPVRQAIARIVGEIVANAAKHAPGSVLDLRMTLDHEVRITACNTLATNGADAVVPSSGIGIRVMRERAEAFGGALDSRKDADGWRVDVRIPVQASVPEAAR
ncbi:histidine kinase [Paramicrobacterium agarici]|uniref:histidine kinase n=1 Tax=Paramicrobacterium agarici TaxID=630514 RepID=A0A2A9DU47_9MICO|nr:histidine kinase [Microbacterium agarici]PFG29440.1 histidine kinase [Microbacterium agarici]